jgi:hypothetical protein
MSVGRPSSRCTTNLSLTLGKPLPFPTTKSGSFWNLQSFKVSGRVPILAKIGKSSPSSRDLSMILELELITFHVSASEICSRKVGLVDGRGGVRFDPLAIRYSICCLVLIGNVIVMLSGQC